MGRKVTRSGKPMVEHIWDVYREEMRGRVEANRRLFQKWADEPMTKEDLGERVKDMYFRAVKESDVRLREIKISLLGLGLKLYQEKKADGNFEE